MLKARFSSLYPLSIYRTPGSPARCDPLHICIPRVRSWSVKALSFLEHICWRALSSGLYFPALNARSVHVFGPLIPVQGYHSDLKNQVIRTAPLLCKHSAQADLERAHCNSTIDAHARTSGPLAIMTSGSPAPCVVVGDGNARRRSPASWGNGVGRPLGFRPSFSAPAMP